MLRARGLEVDVRQDLVQPLRHPPVEVAHQLHRGRHEHQPDDGGVEEDRDGERDADLLDLGQAGHREDQEDEDHDHGRARDRLRRVRQTAGHGGPVVMGLVVALLDPREQEHLVVHRQAEDDRQDQRRCQRVDIADVIEADQAVGPAPLEHDHQHAVGRAHGQQVHHDRLQRQHDRPHQHQQHEVAEEQDEQRDLPQRAGDQVGEVVILRRGTADVDVRARKQRGRARADALHERVRRVALRVVGEITSISAR